MRAVGCLWGLGYGAGVVRGALQTGSTACIHSTPHDMSPYTIAKRTPMIKAQLTI